MATCPNCQKYRLPSIGSGVNPRGLNSEEVWQTDVTHFPEFGRLKFIHVSVDTFSGEVYASAHMGETAKDANKHLLQAFTTLGVPCQIKMDNGPAYISKRLQTFFRGGELPMSLVSLTHWTSNNREDPPDPKKNS